MVVEVKLLTYDRLSREMSRRRHEDFWPSVSLESANNSNPNVHMVPFSELHKLAALYKHSSDSDRPAADSLSCQPNLILPFHTHCQLLIQMP